MELGATGWQAGRQLPLVRQQQSHSISAILKQGEEHLLALGTPARRITAEAVSQRNAQLPVHPHLLALGAPAARDAVDAVVAHGRLLGGRVRRALLLQSALLRHGEGGSAVSFWAVRATTACSVAVLSGVYNAHSPSQPAHPTPASLLIRHQPACSSLPQPASLP